MDGYVNMFGEVGRLRGKTVSEWVDGMKSSARLRGCECGCGVVEEI
jgi:hypothetical protein